MSIDGWIDKEIVIYVYIYIIYIIYIHTHTHTHIYTVEYYLATKNNEILSFVFMDLEGIMRNEVSQLDKDKNHMISLIYGIYI